MLYKFLRRTAYKLGYDFSLRKLPQYAALKRELKIPRDLEPEFVDIYTRCKDFTLTSVERMYALYQGVKHIHAHNIPGDLVECGVWRGGSCMVMALTLLSLGDQSRKIYLYDTFAGMTRPDEVDIHLRDGSEQISRWELFQQQDHNEWCYAPLQDVKRNLISTDYPQDSIIFVEGDVESTIPACAPDKISLLRLDTDWFKSTYHELVHLFPRLSRNGVLVVDDYGAYEGSRKAVDRYFSEQHQSILLHRIDTAGRIGINA
ncbi:MAG: TylF/MycF family methyltransferase [Gammaproteobacteria bacterium]|nr:TylF/MycF family methyltransferase [Gammaproteobacteria bacterium]